jgi:prepilin-type N-terminal cleavage/methylation domain-containing protein
MSRVPGHARQFGFTLIELLTALGIFLLVCGIAFMLLGSSQQRYQTEAQVLTSFQEARLGLDQIVRDVNDAGYPPPTYVSTNFNSFATAPFPWSPGYPTSGNPNGTSCTIGTGGGGTCSTPGDFDLIVETNPNGPGAPVQWIRYTLQGTTLMRGTVPKAYNNDPESYTTANAQLAPFVQNVVNNSSAAQIAQYQAGYPNMFPGGIAVPIFSFACDTGNVPTACPLAGTANSPFNIRDVIVTLIVAAPLPDATTGQPRLVQLHGRGRRVNPN